MTVSTEANGLAVSPRVSTGHNVVYTKNGLLPAWLFASLVPPAGIDQFEYITPQGFHGKTQVGVFDN